MIFHEGKTEKKRIEIIPKTVGEKIEKVTKNEKKRLMMNLGPNAKVPEGQNQSF